MNRRIPLSIFALALAGSVSAQNHLNDFQITKISRDLITTPQFNYSGAEQKRETHERWLRVDVQFSAAPDFTEELTLKYYILMNGKVLTGEVTHANVLAGRDSTPACMCRRMHSLMSWAIARRIRPRWKMLPCRYYKKEK